MSQKRNCDFFLVECCERVTRILRIVIRVDSTKCGRSVFPCYGSRLA